jgi:hypothetical protein
VISATGLYTPPHAISNQELVESYNAWAENWNRENEAEIKSGLMEPKPMSSVEFIEKASGIKSRFVVDKSGVIDPDIMAPRIAERPNEQISVLAEMAVMAAREAMAAAGRKPEDIGAVICAASNMQRAYPAMAIEVQQALGIEIPDEPEPMAPVEAIPGTHAPGIRYACAAIAQTVADLYRMAADAERLAGLAEERERLIQQTQAAARPPASAAPTRRQRSK